MLNNYNIKPKQSQGFIALMLEKLIYSVHPTFFLAFPFFFLASFVFCYFIATVELGLTFLPLVLMLALALHSGSDRGNWFLALVGSLSILLFSSHRAFVTNYPYAEVLNFLRFNPWPFMENTSLPLSADFMFGTQNIMATDQLTWIFIVLTNLVVFISILVSRSLVRDSYKLFIYMFLLLQFLILQFFLALNLLLFYVLFEVILVPMFFIIGIWGGRERRTFAAYSFFLFTAFGSLFMLLGIAFFLWEFPTLSYFTLLAEVPFYSLSAQICLFTLFFLGFAVKIPMFPFHLWLPEAHVEAPTLGSIILAGVLLKLGGYGMLRFLLPLFPLAIDYLLTPLLVLCIVSVLYSAFIGLCQLDMKKIIAYSSVTHMNFAVAGIFAGDYLAIQGAIYSMFSHGLIASALFLCVGVVYDRYHTRLLAYYGGLSNVMPFFSGLLFFFVIANTGLPPLSGFISEITVLAGLANVNLAACFLLFLSSIAMTINFFWFYNRICTGPVSPHLRGVRDVRWDEGSALLLLAVLVILLGLRPALLFDYCEFVSAFIRPENLLGAWRPYVPEGYYTS